MSDKAPIDWQRTIREELTARDTNGAWAAWVCTDAKAGAVRVANLGTALSAAGHFEWWKQSAEMLRRLVDERDRLAGLVENLERGARQARRVLRRF